MITAVNLMQIIPLVTPRNNVVALAPACFQFKEHVAEPAKLKKFSPRQLDQAQDLIYQGWETTSREKRINLAYRALDTSPYCADAYVLLARESDYATERLELYQHGVEVGKLALDDSYFAGEEGHLWLMLETRPYMRALYGLAITLDELGEKQKAISYYQELLRLNNHDNQGARYNLAFCLLEQNRLQELGKLLDTYQEDGCFFAYTKALRYYCLHGPKEKARQFLLAALESNRYVPEYLLGAKHLPYREPDYYSWGDEDEAIIYAKRSLPVWQNTPSALAWLAEFIR